MEDAHVVVVAADSRVESADVIRSLKKQRAFAVSGPFDALHTLRRCARHPPAAVVIHVELRDISGPELCQLIRSRKRTARMPLVLFSSRGSGHAPRNGFDSADVYLSLAEQAEAGRRVAELLNQSPADSKETPLLPMFEGRHLTANFQRVSVSVDGSRIDLTRRELQLLQFLVTHRNHVLTRHDMLVQIWNGENDGRSRTIDTHIRRLRAKLGAAADQIQTLPRLGYRFNEE